MKDNRMKQEGYQTYTDTNPQIFPLSLKAGWINLTLDSPLISLYIILLNIYIFIVYIIIYVLIYIYNVLIFFFSIFKKYY